MFAISAKGKITAITNFPEVFMSATISQNFVESPNLKKQVDQLVDAVMQASQKIPRDIRPPKPELQDSALRLIEEAGSIRGRPLFYKYIGSGLGNGPFVELIDGSVKLDLINGIGIHIMGHSHPKVIEASIQGALSDVVQQGNLQPNTEYYRTSKKLLEVASRKSRLKHVWLATCGTMANENALKACRQKRSAARMIIAMQSAFAGRSSLMAEVTDNPSFKVGLPDYNEVLRVPFFDKKDPKSAESSLRILKEHVAKHGKNVGCFTFEPVQGEGGFNVAPREYFLPMLDFCKEQGIPIWLDEVQTFMRTGQFFAFQTLEIGDYVDVCTVAKTVQNGATFFTEEMNPQPGLIAGTFSGSSVALTAGLKILEELDGDEYMGSGGRVQKIHDAFVQMLKDLNETTCKGLLSDAGGLGLMVAVTPLDGSKEKVGALLNKLFDNGLIAFNCGRGPFRLRFLLPAVMTEADIAVAKRIIEKSILELA